MNTGFKFLDSCFIRNTNTGQEINKELLVGFKEGDNKQVVERERRIEG